jgi:hypothetical protein
VGRVVNIEIVFHSSGEWESSGPESAGYGDGANSMLQFREGRQWDKVLHKDEAEAVSSSWLNGKKA